ncbi:hypothetical protein [Streptomyces canus]|uniref:hypothetical protein n=1 Tax=Streptomyces canus TaxID=58343 RepID=UPI002E2ED61E|nr:hypothetical protein [Streptomyces canus]
MVTILRWVERNSVPVSVWEDPEKVDDVLQAIDTRLDGMQAAAWSRERHRRILNVVMKYAIRRRILRTNPLPKGEEATTATKTTNAVDKCCLQAAARLLRHAVLLRTTPRRGHGHASGGREPARRRRRRPVGKQWTDTGEIHEQRDLKGRAEGETRTVPGYPALTRILRRHIEDEELKPGDLLFQGENGGILAGSVIRRAWRSARRRRHWLRMSSSRRPGSVCTTTGTPA